MGSWKDFIAEVPIINRRSEGIFVKADHVLDLWEERNNLRAEIAQMRGGGPAPVSAEATALPTAVDPNLEASIREQCAREAEEFARTYTADPDLQAFAVELMRGLAERLRPRTDEDAADFLSSVEIPPAAQPIPSAEPVEGWIPTADPVAETGAEGDPFDFRRTS